MPALMSLENKAKAKQLYLAGGLKLQEIADQVGVSFPTLSLWIKDGKWREERESLEKQVLDNCAAKVREFFEKHKLDTLGRHLEAAKAIEERILNRLKGINPTTGKPFYLTERDLATLAKALKDSADVSGPASGITEQTLNPQLPANGMLVLVGVQPKRVSKAIDVASTQVDDPF